MLLLILWFVAVYKVVGPAKGLLARQLAISEVSHESTPSVGCGVTYRLVLGDRVYSLATFVEGCVVAWLSSSWQQQQDTAHASFISKILM